jgi:hypothetical protein
MDEQALPARGAAALFAALSAGDTADAGALAWLERGAPRVPFARGAFFGFYAGAGRRFPGSPGWNAEQRASLVSVGVRVPEVWSGADVARAFLLLSASAVADAGEHVSIATEAFRRGDNAERVALLRALPLFPEPARFTELAIEACRSNVLDVFAAIACENPFPAAWFPELHFNQLVIKALFMQLALERVLDWETRRNPELARIAGDYAAERRAAGRTVPEDIALIRATTEEPR